MSETVFENSKWIWAEQVDSSADDVVIFRRPFNVDKPPKTAVARIAAENRYFLYLNGKEVVVGGGMLRTGRSGKGFYDEIDLSGYIEKGENVISVIAMFYGTADNKLSAGKAGLLFECPELSVSSDSGFTVYRDRAYSAHPDYAKPKAAGINIKYDATLESMLTGYQKPEFVSNLFVAATELGEYGAEPWGEVVKRPVPLFAGKLVEKCRKIDKRTNVLMGDRYADEYTLTLPRAMNVYPRLSVTANSGDRIEVKSERYEVGGCYEDEGKSTNGFRFEYICKAEAQTFEFPQTLYGERLIFSITPGVKVQALGYRESLYGSVDDGELRTDDEFLGALQEKCADTLVGCMREGFVDTPERGNYVLPAAASVGADGAFYLFEDGGVALAEKFMADTLELAENDILYASVYGERKELPSQMLIALSEFGIAAKYYAYVGMNEKLAAFVVAGLKYLAKWEQGEDGFIAPRTQAKCDDLFNCDEKLVLNMLYYSALNNVCRLMEATGDDTHSGFLDDRAQSLKAALDACYDGMGYSSVKGFYDDRANAFAVLSGIADNEEYTGLTRILESVACATPLYEGYVLEALCVMGEGNIALRRMKSRYHDMVENGRSTLSEDFAGRGAKSYLGSVAPLPIMYRYFAGINFDEGLGKIVITPDLRSLGVIDFRLTLEGGKLSGRFAKVKDRVEVFVDNSTGKEVLLLLKSEFIGKDIDGMSEKGFKLTKGKNKFTI